MSVVKLASLNWYYPRSPTKRAHLHGKGNVAWCRADLQLSTHRAVHVNDNTACTRCKRMYDAYLREQLEDRRTRRRAFVPPAGPPDVVPATFRRTAPSVGPDGRVRMRSEEERKRVLAIATRIVVGQLSKGEIPDTEEAVKAATREAVTLATEAYRAAEDYLRG